MGLKKIVMLTFWVGFVAGCTPLHPSDCHKTTATGSCSSGRWDDQDEWGAQARGIRAAINAKLDEPHNWKGKKCRLHGFAPIFPDICYHLTHYKPAAADIPVASDNPAHYADAIRYNARTPLQGSLLPLTRLVWA